MVKILFLDIDGVLNCMPGAATRMALYNKDKELFHNKLYGLDPDLVKNLKLILDRTGAKIVFSTSWRYFKDHPIVGSDWRESLAKMLGVSQDIFIGNTPDINTCGDSNSGSRRRGSEIIHWLTSGVSNNTIEIGKFKYCVIDDEVSDIIGVIPERCVVHTDMNYGLQMKDVNRAVKILNE